MQKKTCFFIGHRDAPDSILTELLAEVERHIVTYGVTNFIAGHYGAFERLAAKAVIQVKTHYPHVTLTMLLPYHPIAQPCPLLVGVDDTLYPEGLESVLRRLAIINANRYMVDHSDYIIAYVWHPASNASSNLQYAKRKNVPVCNLAEMLHQE